VAHFAELDENNKVIRVLVVSNEVEHRGEDYLVNELGFGGRWVQTSYNHNFRNKFAGEGDVYDPEADVFYSPSPYPSWTLNRTTWNWEAPSPRPEGLYIWNEETLSWVQRVNGESE
jgi:hypothetical protein